MNDSSPNALPYRPNVCMLVFNQRGELFLGERKGEPGVWQLPQGGAKKKLSLEENVLKELHEELGAEKEDFRIIKQLQATHQYDFGEPPPYAVNKWRGQSQTFWLVEFLGNDKDIRIDRFEAEFSDWQWCPLERVRATVEEKRRGGYEAALDEFESYWASGNRTYHND